MADNAAFIAMAGPARALNTLGGQVAWQASAFGAILAGLMSMFLVGRHTRAEEESGRDELVRAGAVGAPRAAAAAASSSCSSRTSLLGGLVAASLIGYGLAAAGSVEPRSCGGAVRAGLRGRCPRRRAAHREHARDVRHHRRGDRGVVRPASRRRRRKRRAVMAVPDRLGQAMHAFSGERWWPALISVAAVVALRCAALRLFDASRHRGRYLAHAAGAGAGGTSAAGVASAWPGGCSAAASSAGSLGLFLTGWPTAPSATTSRTSSATPSSPTDVFGQGGGSLVDSFYAAAGAAARADRRRLLDLVGAAPARRGGRRPRRDAARHARCPVAVGAVAPGGHRGRHCARGRRGRSRARPRICRRDRRRLGRAAAVRGHDALRRGRPAARRA